MFCRIFWKLRSYLISKIENHVFEPFLEGRAQAVLLAQPFT